MTTIATGIRRLAAAALLGSLSVGAQDAPADGFLKGFTIIPLEFPIDHAAKAGGGGMDQSTPEKAARSYLDCLLEGTPIPDRLTILSPYVKPSRLEEIKRERAQLTGLLSANAAWLRGMRHKPRFSILSAREDGDLAIVLYRIANDDFPLSFLGSSLTLVRQEGQWKVAPLAASFSNAGLAYERNIRKRADQLTSGINEQLTRLLKQNKQDKLAEIEREVARLRQAGRDKTREQLLLDVVDAMYKRDPVVLTALIEPERKNDQEQEDEKNREPEHRFTATLQDMGMLIEDPQRLEYSFSGSLMDFACDASSVILPIGSGPPGDGEGEGQVHSLAVLVLNRIPIYKVDRRRDQVPVSLLRIELKDPREAAAHPYFLKKMNEKTDSLPPPGAMEDELAKAFMAAFHRYHSVREWDDPKEAARDILALCCRADTAGVLSCVDPAYFRTGDPRIFEIVLDFCRNLIMSSQMRYGSLRESSDNNGALEQKGATLAKGYFIMISNPATKMGQHAAIYLQPGHDEAYVLADEGNPGASPGTSRIKFKIAKNSNGKWQLKVYPGDFPTLESNGFEIAPLTNERNKREKPTLREDDPALDACLEHYLDTFLQ